MFDLNRVNTALTAETKEEKLFVKYCREYGLSTTILHKNITNIITKKTYEIIGITKRGRFACFVCTDHVSPMDMCIDLIKAINPKYYQIES